MINKEETLARIAKALLSLDTLESRNSDKLDYHRIAVWNIASALEAAYHAGYDACAPKTPGYLRRLAAAEAAAIQ